MMIKAGMGALILAASMTTGFSFNVQPPSVYGEQVIGAFSGPPSGPGPGTIVDWSIGQSTARIASFAPASTLEGNSFFVGYDIPRHEIFIPTEAGTTVVMNSGTLKPTATFPSLPGGRLARVTPNHHMVLELSSTQIAAYSLSAGYKQRFVDSVGGNAVIVSPNGHDAFVGGNMDSMITEIALPSGRIVRQFPVPQSGDLIWAHGQIFSADIKTGVMTVLNPRTGAIKQIPTPEVDPSFSYQDIPGANAGFMQLAVSPGQNYVYAAGFSGHILKFSALTDSYLGEVSVRVNTQGPNQLSGLAVLPGGKTALVTVENLKDTAVVDLSSGKILRLLPHVASNRWVVIP
ncbi:YncE family protein [Sulfobacillus thermosulfidooxidans]|uniref:YncE family protein n=1 Tax=Sulfobacillus thermosulfidooxidans TaxID=28034 RepID=UPI0006B539AB|nr:hypothetical protein [Sulfobacillus thermosulfidooxidans]